MEELVSTIESRFAEFAYEAGKRADGNKAAGTRARKLSLELTTLLKKFRKESI